MAFFYEATQASHFALFSSCEVILSYFSMASRLTDKMLKKLWELLYTKVVDDPAVEVSNANDPSLRDLVYYYWKHLYFAQQAGFSFLQEGQSHHHPLASPHRIFVLLDWNYLEH